MCVRACVRAYVCSCIRVYDANSRSLLILSPIADFFPLHYVCACLSPLLSIRIATRSSPPPSSSPLVSPIPLHQATPSVDGRPPFRESVRSRQPSRPLRSQLFRDAAPLWSSVRTIRISVCTRHGEMAAVSERVAHRVRGPCSLLCKYELSIIDTNFC